MKGLLVKSRLSNTKNLYFIINYSKTKTSLICNGETQVIFIDLFG